MPKHYAIGKNVQTGTVDFDNQKICTIVFPISFSYHPAVTITLENTTTTHVPVRTKVSKAEFKILFQTPYTGTVGWTAMEAGNG